MWLKLQLCIKEHNPNNRIILEVEMCPRLKCYKALREFHGQRRVDLT